MSVLKSIVTLAAAAALVLGGASAAVASPQAVLEDYYADGVVDSSYSVADLTRALTLARAQEDAQYADAATAIESARARALTGGHSGGDAPGKGAPVPTGDPGGGVSSLERPRSEPSALPTPPLVEPGADVPWPFVVLSGLAVLLGIGGAASAVYRRMNRATPEGS